MRMPTYDLADWKKIVDGIHDDGGNTCCSGSPGLSAARNSRSRGNTTPTTKTSATNSCAT